MTDEELKPFIGKEVRAVINGGTVFHKDTEVSGILCILNAVHDTRTVWYRVYPSKYGFIASEFVDVKLEEEPKKAIPKGFINVKSDEGDMFIKASAIVVIMPCNDGTSHKATILVASCGNLWSTDTADEIMTKIAEALND